MIPTIPPRYRLAQYEIMALISEGGMGAVYRAIDRLTGKTVALKRVLVAPQELDFGSRNSGISMHHALAREFEILSTLRHPNVISVLDYGFDEKQQPYYTMTLLEGSQTLAQAAKTRDLKGQIELLIQVLQALSYLHRRGVIHRDLKPANILIDSQGQAKVLDFGLAVKGRETSKSPAGTLTYMPPEILQGNAPGVQSDLYTVGVIAYEMLTGQRPFVNTDISQLTRDILVSTPDLSRLPLLLSAAPAPGLIDGPARQVPTEAIDTFPFGDNAILTEHQPMPSDIQPGPSASVPVLTLRDLVGKLLQKAPSERYSHADDVIAALCQIAELPLPQESIVIRESFLQAAEFVGRQKELTTLSAALTAALEGKGSAWLIGGESGVGKSRLLNELATTALVRGMLVLRGQAVAEGDYDYQLWRDPLRRLAISTPLAPIEISTLKRLIPDIDHLTESPVSEPLDMVGGSYANSEKQRLAFTVMDILRRQSRPTLLLLEDLQWANESLDVLKALVKDGVSLPIMILATYRSDEKPELAQAIPQMVHLRLDRLDFPAIAELSVSMLGSSGHNETLLNLLHQETEGNIFFIIEVIRALAEEAGRLADIGKTKLPDRVIAGGIQQILDRHLHRVPEADRRLLNSAAILGRVLDPRILQALCPTNDLERWFVVCANAAVLEFRNAGWRFIHDKLRERAVAALSNDERVTLHREAAGAIECTYGDERAAELAFHWARAGNTEKERHFSRIAGGKAIRTRSYHAAMPFLQRAYALLPGEGSEKERADLEAQLADTFQANGEVQCAEEYGRLALDRYERLGDRLGIAKALRSLAAVESRKGNFMASWDYAQKSLTLATELGDKIETILATRNLGVIAGDLGKPAEAEHYLRQCIALFKEIGEPAYAEAEYSNLAIVIEAQGRYEEAEALYREHIRCAMLVGDKFRQASALNNLGFLCERLGRTAEAVGYYEKCVLFSREFGNRVMTAAVLANLGSALLVIGQDKEAAPYLHEALDLSLKSQLVPYVLEILVGFAELLRRQQQPERAAELLGLILHDDAANEDVQVKAGPALAQLKVALSDAALEAAFACGKARRLDAAAQEMFAEFATPTS